MGEGALGGGEGDTMGFCFHGLDIASWATKEAENPDPQIDNSSERDGKAKWNMGMAGSLLQKHWTRHRMGLKMPP